ncbi:MAG: glycosyltransferase family 87 protein [Candidatus Hodarchaeota archaeon]
MQIEKKIKIIQLFIYFLVIFVFLVYYFNVKQRITDYIGYYEASRQILQDYTKVYEYEVVGLFYRYFPTFLFLILPITVLPFPVSYCIFTTINFIISILAMIYLGKIIKLLQWDNKKMRYAVFFLPSTVVSLFYAQVTTILSFLVILSLYLRLKEETDKSNLVLGISMVIKPITIFIFLTYLISLIKGKEFKKMIRSILFFLIPLSSDILLFLFAPGLLESYIRNAVLGLDMRPESASISFASLFHYLFNQHLLLFVIICVLIYGVFSLIYVKSSKENKRNNAIMIYIIGIVWHFFGLIDVWTSQLILLYVGLILFDPINKRRTYFIIIFEIIAQFVTLTYYVVPIVSIIGMFGVAFLFILLLKDIVDDSKKI